MFCFGAYFRIESNELTFQLWTQDKTNTHTHRREGDGERGMMILQVMIHHTLISTSTQHPASSKCHTSSIIHHPSTSSIVYPFQFHHTYSFPRLVTLSILPSVYTLFLFHHHPSPPESNEERTHPPRGPVRTGPAIKSDNAAIMRKKPASRLRRTVTKSIRRTVRASIDRNVWRLT